MAYSVVFTLPPIVRVLLAANTDLANVEILTGPRRVKAGADALAIQDMRATHARVVTGGWRRESGSFIVRAHVEVSGAGEDAIDAARERADALLGFAADVLEADCTLGGVLLSCDVTEVAEDDQAAPQNQHEFTAHMTVSFTADVQPGV